jgi:hypothetical protein
VTLPRHGDHARRQIDTHDRDTVRSEICGHLSRSAAEVKHHAKARNMLREVAELGPLFACGFVDARRGPQPRSAAKPGKPVLAVGTGLARVAGSR